MNFEDDPVNQGLFSKNGPKNLENKIIQYDFVEHRAKESRLLVTNESKGKKQIILGNVITGLGVVIPVAGFTNLLCHFSPYFNQQEIHNAGNDFVTTLVAGGIIAGIGLGTKLYGKIKNWYYNK